MKMYIGFGGEIWVAVLPELEAWTLLRLNWY
jgi:hypothetical protein